MDGWISNLFDFDMCACAVSYGPTMLVSFNCDPKLSRVHARLLFFYTMKET